MKAILLLVRAVVLFIYNDDAGPCKRGKYGGSSAYNNGRLAAAGLSLMRAPLLIGKI